MEEEAPAIIVERETKKDEGREDVIKLEGEENKKKKLRLKKK